MIDFSGIPPRLRLGGDRRAAYLLRGFARLQLETLRQQISQGDLYQGVRRLLDPSGRSIRVWITGAQSGMEIYVPPAAAAVAAKEIRIVEIECWCTCCFSQAEILEIHGMYNSRGTYAEGAYPTICNTNDLAVQNYTGIRYKVRVCQKKKINEYLTIPQYAEWIAISSDFSNYEVGDQVIALFRGHWQFSTETGIITIQESQCYQCINCEDNACNQANWPPNREFDDTWNAADGVWLITPIVVTGVNDG